ncbi:DUF2799 domain-containing protein [Undibacterium squillarum]|uniref:DUF2799 domain-containing protein n=1 Tax=Undibacterium squillarum TaxID=1131567 RepID=A0ABQ2Y217_9BURK|nr:DUF2799 domain-containing protein [Undibacterium squillarum]GGX50949.1 hypothetical protein GCM10010946_32180 [Undibacterium squillarum]
MKSRLTSQNLRMLGLIAGVAMLSACQSTITRMNDCKSGDWQMIGRKDGEAGLTAQFDDRRDFCAKVDNSKVTAESGTLYLGGWTSGNQQFWYRLGRDDGNRALPVSQFAQQLKSEKVVENKTPPQERFYVDGWTLGNGEYWFRTGDADGRAGSPVKLEQQRQQEGAAIGFRSDQYRSGWSQGNQGYWFQLGVADAHDGIPDSRFKEHEQNAKQREVFVRADAYQQGWDKEIIEYWRRLAWEDAVNGRDANNRRVDAQARGLKFSESQYQDSWQARLVQYWQDAGAQDGWGRPYMLEQRMANAQRDRVFVIAQTRDVYTAAWNRKNDEYCTPANAFDWARRGNWMAVNVCRPELQWRLDRAVRNGREFEHLEDRIRRAQSDAREFAKRVSDVENRIRQLERDAGRLAEVKDIKDNKDSKPSPNNADELRRNERERAELRGQIDGLRRQQREAEEKAARLRREQDQLRFEALH